MFGGCTIVAANYVAQARVLAASFRRAHPASPFWVLVVDDPEGLRVGGDEDFTVLHLADVAIGDQEAHQLAAIYDVLELSTAVKPWLLQHLVAETGAPVLYLDPDIEVFAPLDDLAALAGGHGLALTPHLLEPLPLDGLLPDDAHMMGSGTYNLGFLGVGPRALDGGFFDFWQSRLWRRAIVDVGRQLFTDQRWLDWVDCFDYAVVRDPGCNVAYWNVWSRPIRRVGDEWRAGDAALRFFHFSGFDPRSPWVLSRHQGPRPRVLLSEHPDLAALCRRYAAALGAAGHDVCRDERYGWARSGTIELTPAFRRVYRTELMAAEEGGRPLPPNPFDEPDRFLTWLAEPADAACAVPRFVLAEHDRRADLRAAFPEPCGASREALLEWASVDEAFRSTTPRALLALLTRPTAAPAAPLPGINVSGYLSAELGVGAVGRLVVRAAQAAGIPFATHEHRVTISRAEHPHGAHGDPDWRYDVNVLCANADATPLVIRDLPLDACTACATVAIWHWEAERLPPAVLGAWDLVDEVWATSRFALEAFSRDATKPVRLFPLPVPVPAWSTSMTRADVGLPDGFVVLFCFDWLSVVDRKNPAGLVDAFCRAFRPEDGAHLVLKSINGHARLAEMERLRLSIDRPDVHLVDGYVSWLEMQALMELADCYASLHRSEGFGLTMAEAMALAKPVVATGWSGNLDFMDDAVAQLVPASLVAIPDEVEVYGGIGSWADPDLDAAAAALRWVFERPSDARRLGRRAQDHLATTRSTAVAGRFLKEHAERLRREHASRARAMAG